MKKAQEGVQAALEQLQGEVEAERAGNKDAFARLQAAAEAEEAARRAAEGKLAEAEAAAEQLRSHSAADLRRLQDEKRAADARISALQTRLDGMQARPIPKEHFLHPLTSLRVDLRKQCPSMVLIHVRKPTP